MDILQHRAVKDEFFGRSHDSPLTADQRSRFAGLSYYDPSPEHRFVVSLDPPDEGGVDEVEMSDGSTDHLERAGMVRFSIDGEAVSVLAYRQGEDLFIPFRDTTSGGETYGAGRYVEAEPTLDGHYVLDFNLAYNPYCAYNESWRCPLPPRENWLKVPIRAGEKTFAH